MASLLHLERRRRNKAKRVGRRIKGNSPMDREEKKA
jgi:hypothetical protein